MTTSALLADFLGDDDRERNRTIWVAILISMLVHALVMWEWLPRLYDLSLDSARKEAASGPLQVQLVPRAAPRPAPPPAPPAAPALRPQPPAPKPAPPPKAAPKKPPSPPVLALNRPGPGKPAPAPAPAPPPPKPTPAPAPMPGDLSSYIAAQRRARGEAASSAPPALPAERAGDPRDQVVAANLGLNRTPTFGDNPETGGGIFQIRRMGYDDAEFMFFGLNRDIRRNTAQLIEVRKGNNSSMEIAVVRRMIQIIRDNAEDDFVWVSNRLGRNVTLSARPRDNAGLEAFLMEEFFGSSQLR